MFLHIYPDEYSINFLSSGELILMSGLMIKNEIFATPPNRIHPYTIQLQPGIAINCKSIFYKFVVPMLYLFIKIACKLLIYRQL